MRFLSLEMQNLALVLPTQMSNVLQCDGKVFFFFLFFFSCDDLRFDVSKTYRLCLEKLPQNPGYAYMKNTDLGFPNSDISNEHGEYESLLPRRSSS